MDIDFINYIEYLEIGGYGVYQINEDLKMAKKFIKNLDDEKELLNICLQNPNVCFIWIISASMAPDPIMKIISAVDIDFNKFNNGIKSLVYDQNSLKKAEDDGDEGLKKILLHEIVGYHKMWLEYIRSYGIKYIINIDKGWR